MELEPLKVFVDADVLIAGAVSPSTESASVVILQLGSLTLLQCLISEQVRMEAIRNIQKKVPRAEKALAALIDAAVEVVGDPVADNLKGYEGQADPKDLPILVAAIENNCSYLVTFNTRHYYPTRGPIVVVKPGDLLVQIRGKVAELAKLE
jgi:predicted nucleic acid-binding protein